MVRHLRAIRAALFPFVSSLALAACSGSSTSLQPLVNRTLAPTPAPTAVATVAPVDDWVTFAHDDLRTGYQRQNTGISKANVAKLALRWTTTLPDQVYSSPLVYGGLVILAGQNSAVVYALSSATGKIVWQTHLDGQLHSTGAIADGQLFMGSHDFAVSASGDYVAAPSHFYDIDVVTGAVRWMIPVDGTVRGTPVAAGGRVYYAVAGGDLPKCYHGGVSAVEESSGAPVWSWHVDADSGVGGAVWAPLTFDGTTLYFGTGNTCGPAISTANGFVALSALSGALDWSLVAQPDSVSDDDTGGGAVMLNDSLYFISKDGRFYSVNKTTGQLQASVTLNPTDYAGGFATATSDGTTILVGNGDLSPASDASSRTRRFYSVRRREATASPGSDLVALDAGLNVKWQIPVAHSISSYAAINAGVVYATLDDTVVALDIDSGNKLWTYETSELIDGGPVIVPSGLYVANASGVVYAFGLPRSNSAAKSVQPNAFRASGH